MIVGGLNFLDSTLHTLILPLLPVYEVRFALSEVELGLVLAIYALALLPATWVVAALSRFVSASHLLVAGVGILMLSTLLFNQADGLGGLLLARGVQGVAAAGPMTVGTALVAAWFPPVRRGWALGQVAGMSTLGFLAGPLLGGGLSGWLGLRAPFLVVTAGIAVLTLAALVLLRGRRVERGRSLERVARPLLLPFLRNRQVRTLVAVAIVGGVLMGAIEPMLPLAAKRRFDTTPATFGILFGIMIGSLVVVAPAVGWLSDRIGRLESSRVGLLSCVLPAALYVSAPTPIWFLVAMLLNGVSFTMILIPTNAALTECVDAVALAGRERDKGVSEYTVAAALNNTAASAGTLVGPLAGTALLAHSHDVAFWSLGLLGLGAGTLLCLPTSGGASSRSVGVPPKD